MLTTIHTPESRMFRGIAGLVRQFIIQKHYGEDHQAVHKQANRASVPGVQAAAAKSIGGGGMMFEPAFPDYISKLIETSTWERARWNLVADV